MSVNTGILGLSARWCTYDLGVLNGIKSSHISGGVRRCLQGKYTLFHAKIQLLLYARECC